MTSAARQYVRLTMSVAVGVLLLIALFNGMVDPLNFLGLNKLGVYTPDERKVKPGYVRQFPHDALLIGNSRMSMVPVSKLQGGFHFFNAALGGANPAEMYYFIEHYARDLKVVVIGIDLGAKDPAEDAGDLFLPESLSPGLTDTLNYLVSLKSVEFSFHALQEKFAGYPPSIARDGTFDATKWRQHRNQDDPVRLAWELDHWKKDCDKYSREAFTQMEYFKKIAACLQERHIPCVVVIPPLHEEVARHLQSTPVYAAYRMWLDELASIFPTRVDLSFSPYNAHANYFKTDPMHFTPEAAERMFNSEVMPVAAKVSLPPKR